METAIPKQKRFKTDYPGVTFIMGTILAEELLEVATAGKQALQASTITGKKGRTWTPCALNWPTWARLSGVRSNGLKARRRNHGGPYEKH